MLQPLDRIKRTFGLKVDTRFVSKLITTQYDDLTFSENGQPVHPEMEDILQLFGAMEQFAEDANKRMEGLDMPSTSGDAQKEMEEVLERVAKMAAKSNGESSEPGVFKGLLNRLSERSKGSTRERFSAVFKAAVDSAVVTGEQVKAEKEYLYNFGELEQAMSEGTILASKVRKRQNERSEAATLRLTEAAAIMDASSMDSDDYAQIRHDAGIAQRTFDLENKRRLFATELYSKMSLAHDFATTLAMSLAQKTLTKESLWIATTNSLSTQQATFSMAQANLSSMDGMNEATRMKAIMDRGSSGVIESIGKMSVELQKRATLIAHSGGPGSSELQMIARSILEGQRVIAPLREQLIHDQAQSAEKVKHAALTFQKEMRSVVVDGAQKSLAHQKQKRDGHGGLAIGHDQAPTLEGRIISVEDAAVAVETAEGVVHQSRRASP